MTRDEVIRLTQEAGLYLATDVNWMPIIGIEYAEKLAALVAAAKEHEMRESGWRQCAKGQRTTQYCGQLEAAVAAEREECAKVCDWMPDGSGHYGNCAAAIRARGEKK